MKQVLLIITAFVFTTFSHAQITVNNLDLNVGDVVLQVSDSNFQTSLLAPGTDLSWDFSGLHGNWTDTIAPIDPTTTSHASSFPAANIALGTTDLAAYFSYTNAGIVNLGFGGTVELVGQDAEIVNSIPDTIIKFPLNYNDSRVSNSWGESTTITYQSYTGKITNSVKRTQNCDAWGTATTPEGIYDVLRVQEETITIDSVFAVIWGFDVYVDSLSSFDTSYYYNFYTNAPEIKLPLLEVEYDPSTDEIINTKWITFPDEVGISTASASKFTIYPNPAQNNIVVSTTETVDLIKIYNLKGQLLKTEYINNIDISDLPSAVYIIEVKSQSSISRQKLLIE